MRKITISIMLFLSLVCGLLYAAKKANPPTKPAIVEYDNEKDTIVITANQPIFKIKLKSNPTTGYSWFLREYDDDIFTPIKHEIIPAPPGLMGAPGFETFTFKVKSSAFVIPEVTSIRFVYLRPWSGIDTATPLMFHVVLSKG